VASERRYGFYRFSLDPFSHYVSPWLISTFLLPHGSVIAGFWMVSRICKNVARAACALREAPARTRAVTVQATTNTKQPNKKQEQKHKQTKQNKKNARPVISRSVHGHLKRNIDPDKPAAEVSQT